MSAVPNEKFEDVLQQVWNHLTAANVHLSIWEELRATPDREKLSDTYPGFFAWTRDAHIDRFVNKICVVTDTDPTQPSVEKLTNMVLSHPDLAPGIDPEGLRERLDRHREVAAQIRDVRNRRSSHWDLKRTPPEPDVVQARELVLELKGILEDVWNAHEPLPDGARRHFDLKPVEHRHPSYVLDMLAEATRAREVR